MSYEIGAHVVITSLNNKPGRVIGSANSTPPAWRVRYETGQGIDSVSVDNVFFDDEINAATTKPNKEGAP